MMEHLKEETLNEYLDGVLDVESRRVVETHLSGCRTCRAQLQSLKSLFATLDSLKREDLGCDLTPLVLNRLPARRLSLGWRLALAMQAGVAGGIFMAALRTLARVIRPPFQRSLAFPSAWERLSGILASSLFWLWKAIFQPCSRLNDMQIVLPVIPYRPQISLPLPVSLFLLAILPVLWWIGSIHLLPDDAEATKPLGRR